MQRHVDFAKLSTQRESRQWSYGNWVSLATYGDDENEESFDFKFDEEGGQWGAGTAFLKE